MATIVITSANQHLLSTSGPGSYFILETEVWLTSQKIRLPDSCVLDVRGGKLFYIYDDEYTDIDLNGAVVYSPACPIFGDNVNVSNFGNSLIHAEWFNIMPYDGGSDEPITFGDEHFINRSLRAALGCPVTLEHRTYHLKAPITFPIVGDAPTVLYRGHKLISPGILELDIPEDSNEEFAAIELNTHYITLDIFRIKGSNFKGSGIKIIGNSYHCDINVSMIRGVNKGFEIVPTVYEKDGSYKDGGIQYTNIKFQQIFATDCFYIDIYSGKSKHPDNKNATWFNECHISGGQLEGKNGINMVNQPNGKSFAPMDGLMFENIGLEGLKGLPLKICNVSGCHFLYLRMMESLPTNAPWLDLKDVEYTEISIKGGLNPDRVKIDEQSSFKGLIIKAWLQDDQWGYHARFNRMVAMPLYQSGSTPDNFVNKPKLTAYSSINPFNMAKTIVVNDENSEYRITDILPVRNDFSTKESERNLPDSIKTRALATKAWSTNYNVLPRTLNIIMDESGEDVVLNVSGMSYYAPCVLDLYLYGSGAKQLIIRTNGAPNYVIDAESPTVKKKEHRCYTTGVYRLTWDSDWNLVISGLNI